MRASSLLSAFVIAAVVAIMLTPADAAAQCGDCELQGTRYKCIGNSQPASPPHCSGTWPFGIACWTCGIEFADAGGQHFELGQVQAVLVAGAAVPDTYMTPIAGCARERVVRAYANSGREASRSGHTMIEVWAKPEAAEQDSEVEAS